MIEQGADAEHVESEGNSDVRSEKDTFVWDSEFENMLIYLTTGSSTKCTFDRYFESTIK